MNQFILEAIKKATVIAIHASARMCDMKLGCHDPSHDDRWCARCDAMEDASDQIQQKILSLLDASEKAKDSVEKYIVSEVKK